MTGDILLAVVALVASVYFVWLHHARVTRRWRAALDAFAEREIDRDRRRSAPRFDADLR